MRRAIAVIAICLLDTSAAAQTPYVTVALGSDVSRFDQHQSGGRRGLEVDGEVLAVTMRAGSGIGESWGIELEFVHPMMLDLEHTQDTPPFVPRPGLLPTGPELAISLTVGTPPEYRLRVRRRNMTLGTFAWLRHELNANVALYYLGGIGLHRFTQQSTTEVVSRGGFTSTRVPADSREVAYNAGPAAGIEARIRMSDHVLVAPGFRLHAFTGGWIVRPNVGVAWSF